MFDNIGASMKVMVFCGILILGETKFKCKSFFKIKTLIHVLCLFPCLSLFTNDLSLFKCLSSYVKYIIRVYYTNSHISF